MLLTCHVLKCCAELINEAEIQPGRCHSILCAVSWCRSDVFDCICLSEPWRKGRRAYQCDIVSYLTTCGLLKYLVIINHMWNHLTVTFASNGFVYNFLEFRSRAAVKSWVQYLRWPLIHAQALLTAVLKFVTVRSQQKPTVDCPCGWTDLGYHHGLLSTLLCYVLLVLHLTAAQ